VAKAVSVANPTPGGHAYTSFSRARKAVKRGDAEWIVHNRSIRFLITPRTEAVKRSAVETLAAVTRRAYDKTVVDGPVLTQRQAMGLPFAGSVKKMGLPY
jgi:hypothetical protein